MCPSQDAREHVATELIGTEQVQEGRWRQTQANSEGRWIVWCNAGAEYRHNRNSGDYGATQQKRAMPHAAASLNRMRGFNAA